MGIIHTAKKHIKDELVRKLQFELLEERKRKNINAILSTRDEVQVYIISWEHNFLVYSVSKNKKKIISL